jgi:hypothetical protein
VVQSFSSTKSMRWAATARWGKWATVLTLLPWRGGRCRCGRRRCADVAWLAVLWPHRRACTRSAGGC